MGSNPIWDTDFFLVYVSPLASCYRNRDKLRPGGPHWPARRLTYYVSPRIYIISCCCYFSVSNFLCCLVLKALLDNYEADENKPEKPSATEQLEEDAFVNAIAVNGGPIHIAFKYLQDKGKVSSGVSLHVSFV